MLRGWNALPSQTGLVVSRATPKIATSGAFTTGVNYTLTVDASAQSVSFTSEEGLVTYTWDDTDDASCPHPSAAVGMELNLFDVPAEQGAIVRFSEESGLERLTVWFGLPSGCVLLPATGG